MDVYYSTGISNVQGSTSNAWANRTMFDSEMFQTDRSTAET